MLLALRINVLAKGYSGISMETLKKYIAAFNGKMIHNHFSALSNNQINIYMYIQNLDFLKMKYLRKTGKHEWPYIIWNTVDGMQLCVSPQLIVCRGYQKKEPLVQAEIWRHYHIWPWA